MTRQNCEMYLGPYLFTGAESSLNSHETEKIDIIQPGDGITSLNETSNRLDALENKVKN